MSGRWCFAAALGLVALNATLAAHEAGSTTVTATVRPDRSVEIVIDTDAEALLEKLETASGESAGPPADAAAIAQRLRQLDEVFLRRVAIRADGAGIPAGTHYTVVPSESDPPRAIVTMRSAIPSAARSLTWKFGWTFTAYSFEVHQEGSGQKSTRLLEGNEESSPVGLAAPAPDNPTRVGAMALFERGYARVLPHGVAQVLFVFGLVLLGRTSRSPLLLLAGFGVAEGIAIGLSGTSMSIPVGGVQPLVLLSLFYVALGNHIASTRRWQGVAAACTCGLIHGIAVAGALETHHERVGVVVFAMGVIVAQLTVAVGAGLLVGRAYREPVLS